MNQPGKKSGCGNRGKTNYVFPTVPTAPTAADKSDEKAAHQNKDDRLHKIPCGSRYVVGIIADVSE
jgi:hypothetical protein